MQRTKILKFLAKTQAKFHENCQQSVQNKPFNIPSYRRKTKPFIIVRKIPKF